jgi:hypothetical protein
MDLVTLKAACALNIEPKQMHALIWKQSGGEPWSFSLPGESTTRVLPMLQEAVREARGTHPGFDRIRIGLTGLSTNPRSVTAVMFAPCLNVTISARQLTELISRCNATSNPEPTYCAIAAYRGSWDRPDVGFADAVRAILEEGNAPNVDLPKKRISTQVTSRPTYRRTSHMLLQVRQDHNPTTARTCGQVHCSQPSQRSRTAHPSPSRAAIEPQKNRSCLVRQLQCRK